MKTKLTSAAPARVDERVVAGSSNGFGYLAANSFGQEGYKVRATSRSPDNRNLTPKRELGSASKNINVIELERR